MPSGDEVTEKVLPSSQPLLHSQDAQIPDISSPPDDVRPKAIDVEIPTGNVVDTETISRPYSTDTATSTSRTDIETVRTSAAHVEINCEARGTQNDDESCPFCRVKVTDDDNGIGCDKCGTWFHQACLHMPDEEFQQLTTNEETVKWYCAWCRSIMSNNIKWGQYEGEERIRQLIQTTYDTIIGWKKNLFSLPRGKCGTEFIKKLTELINLFVNKTKWQRVAISLVHIFIPLMLQKPSAKSKPRDHSKYLLSRLERWNTGDITSLLSEACEIQKRMKKAIGRREQSQHNHFIRLMMFGKIGDAAKKINNDDSIKGVHPLNDEIKDILQQKHPKAVTLIRT